MPVQCSREGDGRTPRPGAAFAYRADPTDTARVSREIVPVSMWMCFAGSYHDGAMKDVLVTIVASVRVPRPSKNPFARIAIVCWLGVAALAALAGAAANAQTTDDSAVGFEWTVSPDNLGPGSAFTIDGMITIDPDSVRSEGEGGTVAWTLIVGPISDVAIDNAACGGTDGTSCDAEINGEDDTVTFSGVVEDGLPGDVTAEVEIAGTIDDQLDRDTILFEAETCGTVEVVTGTPAPGRLPIQASTPDAACDGVEGTIEATVAPATEEPTEEATEVPTEEPTATMEPTATVEPTATATATPEPTEAPTAIPTEEPTPTSVPTEAPTSTSTATPTEEPTATVAPTEEPAATLEPTGEPTASASATEAPTVEATATIEPTPEETAPATEAPQPVPEDDDESGGNTGLWIGGGSLLVLAVAAGAVLYQRRKFAA